MKPRNVLLTSTAAGIALGGLAWYVAHRLTEVGEVEPLHTGEVFPTMTGTTLSGETLTLPDVLTGRIGLLILADHYAARFEVEQWASYAMDTYGEQPELALYEVPLISGVGPLMRKVIDAAMVRGTPAGTQSHVMTVYGDLRVLKKRLQIGGRPRAYVVLLGRTGRLIWRAEGELTQEKRAELDEALAAQGIESVEEEER